MTILDTYTCKLVRPDSLSDATAETYEYMLFWIGANGSPNYWLFEDFIKSLIVKGTVINTENENINKLFQSAKNTVSLIAEDLTLNEVENIETILRAKELRKYSKDNTFEKLAIITSKSKYMQSDFRYNFKIEIAEIDKKTY
ncbi:MAG: hypothetical protein DRI95_00605 [Bacteroidetes bacterium]|nr:MAG: hypothetical protein DRI95_00605 [Bacteroidota bacterium]